MKKTKKLLSLILTLAMLTPLIPAYGVTAEEIGEEPYLVESGIAPAVEPFAEALPGAQLIADEINKMLGTGPYWPQYPGLSAGADYDTVTITGRLLTQAGEPSEAPVNISLLYEGIKVLWNAETLGSVNVHAGTGTFIMQSGHMMNFSAGAVSIDTPSFDFIMTGGTIDTGDTTYVRAISMGGVCDVTISGGTVSSPNSFVIMQTGRGGKVTVSGTARLSGRYCVIWSTDSDVEIMGGTIERYGTDVNAAIHAPRAGVVMTAGSIVVNGGGETATEFYPAAGVYARDFIMTGGTITVNSNQSDSGHGGAKGVRISGGGSLLMTGGTIIANGGVHNGRTNDNFTAGVYGDVESSLTISGGQIISNGVESGTAETFGVRCTSLEMTGGKVTSTGPNSSGARIYQTSTSVTGISRITGGEVHGDAYGIYAGDGARSQLVAYLTETVSSGESGEDVFCVNRFYVNSVERVVEVSVLDVPAAWHGASDGLTARDGYNSPKWDLSGDRPIIDYGNGKAQEWVRLDISEEAIYASTLTAEQGAKIGKPADLTLTLKSMLRIGAAAGDTVTLTAPGVDFTYAALTDDAVYTINAKSDGSITLAFNTATVIDAASGVPATITGVVPSRPGVLASATLDRAGEKPLKKDFPALAFKSDDPATYSLELTASANAWAVPVSGILTNPVTVTARLLDNTGDLVESYSGLLTLSIADSSAAPYIRLNNTMGAVVLDVVNGQGSLDITHVSGYKDLSVGQYMSLYASGRLSDGADGAAYDANMQIYLTMSSRRLTGSVTVNTGAANQAGDDPYPGALVTVTIPEHRSAATGAAYPEMTLSARTGADGSYCIDLPTSHDGCSNDMSNAYISVAEDAMRQIWEYPATRLTNTGTPDNLVANVRCEAYVEIEIFAYDHASVIESGAPDFAEYRTEWNRIPDDNLYSAVLYNGAAYIAQLGRADNSNVKRVADNIWRVSHRYLNRGDGNGMLSVDISNKYPVLTGIPSQTYRTAMGEYDSREKRYTAAVDFVRNGYAEIISPEDAETVMAARFFYKNGNSWYPSGIFHIHPGQRASFGSFTSLTEIAILAVPKQFAAYLSSYSQSYYSDADSTWTVPHLFPEEYLVYTGTVTRGTKLTLSGVYPPVADALLHPEIPDNVNTRIISVKGSSVTVALSFTSAAGDLPIRGSGLYAKPDAGLRLNDDFLSRFFIFPNGLKAYIDSYYALADGYMLWYPTIGIVYNNGNQRQYITELKEGETLVAVLTFDMLDPDDISLVHTINYEWRPAFNEYQSVNIASVRFSLAPNVTIAGDSYSDENRTMVSGHAAPGADVDLYVDDELVNTVKANRAGQYSALVTLFGGMDVKDVESGTISLVTARSGGLESEPLPVCYMPNRPKLFAMADMTHKALLFSPPLRGRRLLIDTPLPGTTMPANPEELNTPENVSALKSLTYDVYSRVYNPASPNQPQDDYLWSRLTPVGQRISDMFADGKMCFSGVGRSRAHLAPSVYQWIDVPGSIFYPSGTVDGYYAEVPPEGYERWSAGDPGEVIVIRADPGEELEYRVLFDGNDEAISKVWVNIQNLSAMGGNDYVMPAVFDAVKGVWAARGELPSADFVMGEISVEYTLKIAAELAGFVSDAGFSLGIPAFDIEGNQQAARDELGKATLPAGMLEDENLPSTLWNAVVESSPDLSTMRVTENADGTITVNFQSVDGPESITGDFHVADMSDPANIETAQRLLSSGNAIPLGDDGVYAVEVTARYRQNGAEKTMLMDDFIWMLLDAADTIKGGADARGIDYDVKLEYVEYVRSPSVSAPQPTRSGILAADDENFDGDIFCTVVSVSLDIYDVDPGENTFDMQLGDGKSVNAGNVMRAISAILGIKDIVDNVNENLDIKYAFKEFNDVLNRMRGLMNTQCFASMDYFEVEEYFNILRNANSNWSKFNRWQHYTRLWNNTKVTFTSGAVIFTAATMGASSSGMVYTRLGSAVNTTITNTGYVITGVDLVRKFTANDYMKMALAANYGELTRFEHSFGKKMMLKCHPPTDKFNIAIGTTGTSVIVRTIYDPSGFAYENGDMDRRVPGVKAEIWQADDEYGTNARFWDEAGEYGEVNPQITGEDGWYAWDVPIGWWQVRLAKDGYEEARSEWLPVLPVQLGVNLEMVRIGGEHDHDIIQVVSAATTPKDFVSMVETAKNSRIWVLTFNVTLTYSDGTKDLVRYSIKLNGNNANQDGKYKFADDHDLAGYTLVYDIKGNGSNIKDFKLIRN